MTDANDKATGLPVAADPAPGRRREVEVLQKFLHRFGYLITDLPDDEYSALRTAAGLPKASYGEFDDATKSALVRYQSRFGLPETGVLDEATVAHMRRPRCGNPDIVLPEGSATFVLLGGRWPRNDLTYGIQNTGSRLSATQVRNALTAAFAQWSRVTNLTFREVPLAAAPDIVFRFAEGAHGDLNPFDGSGRVLGHSTPPPPAASPTEIHFDDAENWIVELPVMAREIDFVTVAVHEIGHALGLDHSDVFGSVMQQYSGPRRVLHRDDIDGIRSLYSWGWDVVYAQGDGGSGIGGCDLGSAADRIVPIDYRSTGSLTHLFIYRPGTGLIRIVKNTAGSFGLALVGGSGIGGYDLLSADDRAFAFDYEGTGRLDDLVVYRPGTGTIWILQNAGGHFRPVYSEGYPGAGIGGYDLKSSNDRVFAYDGGGTGRPDHLVLYRPGTGTIWILRNTGGSFTATFRSGSGLGSFDLRGTGDRAFAFDYTSSGRADHVVLYRPGSGAVHIERRTGDTFAPVFSGSAGIGGYDMMWPTDRLFAYDYEGTGKLDHLVAYRPGTGSLWVLRNNGGRFVPVFRQTGPGAGVAGYDLRSAADRALAFDYAQKGKSDHLALYRPGRGMISILRPQL